MARKAFRNLCCRPRESGDPVSTGVYWVPAFAGTTERKAGTTARGARRVGVRPDAPRPPSHPLDPTRPVRERVRRLVLRHAIGRTQAAPAAARARLARDAGPVDIGPAVVGGGRDTERDLAGLFDRGHRRHRDRLPGQPLARAGAYLRAGADRNVRGAADAVLPVIRRVLRHRAGIEGRLRRHAVLLSDRAQYDCGLRQRR